MLTASAHILETHGLAGFNTNAVAERAGVSIGSLYQYFPGKDAILSALIERRAIAFAAEVEAMVDAAEGETLADEFRILLTRAVGWHSQSAVLSRILDDEERRLGDALDLKPAHARFQASLSALLARHGAGDTGDPDRLIRDVSLIIKALMECEGESPAPDWPTAIERAIGAVLGYLSVAAPGYANRLTQSGAAA